MSTRLKSLRTVYCIKVISTKQKLATSIIAVKSPNAEDHITVTLDGDAQICLVSV